jgi:hypothetical protein
MSTAGTAGGRAVKVWLSLGLLMLTVVAGAVAMGLFSQSGGRNAGAPPPIGTSAAPSETDSAHESSAASPPDARTLVGRWVSASGDRQELTFVIDGTFELRHPTHRLSGTYTVEGATVTLSVPGLHSTTFRWSVDDGFLRLTGPDFKVSEYRRAS